MKKSIPSPAGSSLPSSGTAPNPNRLSGALLMAPAGGLYSSKDKDHHSSNSSTLQHQPSNSLLLMQPTSMFGNSSSNAPPPLMSPTLLNSSTFDEVDNLSRMSIVSSLTAEDNLHDSKFSNYDFDESNNFQMPRNRRSIMVDETTSGRKSYDPFMSPDATSKDDRNLFNTNAENNFLKYNLSFLSFGDDIARSIAKCTDDSMTTPKSKYVRKLIISSWDRGGVPGIYF